MSHDFEDFNDEQVWVLRNLDTGEIQTIEGTMALYEALENVEAEVSEAWTMKAQGSSVEIPVAWPLPARAP